MVKKDDFESMMGYNYMEISGMCTPNAKYVKKMKPRKELIKGMIKTCKKAGWDTEWLEKLSK